MLLHSVLAMQAALRSSETAVRSQCTDNTARRRAGSRRGGRGRRSESKNMRKSEGSDSSKKGQKTKQQCSKKDSWRQKKKG